MAMSAKAHMVSFNELSSEEQAAVREAQRERKQRKAQAREKWAAGKETEREVSRNAPSPGCELLAAAADYPDRISSDSYFGACPGGRFRDPSLPPTAQSLALLLQLLEVEGREEQELNTCCYFQFSGTEDDLWDATFNARLAFEGFFTITSYSHRLRAPEPLPELQPFYGVLTWPNFRAAKPVRAHISKMRRRLQEEDADEADTAVSEKGQINGGRRKQRRLRVVDCEDRHECWRKLEAYHRAKNGSNWLTERYFNMLITASDNPRINFCMHTICLIEDGEGTAAATIVAGEVGFSIGQVYTSLSGWTAERSPEALGTTQLVLLGLWLQRKGYAFWSLGAPPPTPPVPNLSMQCGQCLLTPSALLITATHLFTQSVLACTSLLT